MPVLDPTPRTSIGILTQDCGGKGTVNVSTIRDGLNKTAWKLAPADADAMGAMLRSQAAKAGGLPAPDGGRPAKPMLSTQEMLVLAAKLPALIADASRVGLADLAALRSALAKVKAASPLPACGGS